MCNLAILIILILGLYFYLKNYLEKNFLKIKNKYKEFQNIYLSLLEDDKKNQHELLLLEKKAEDIIALYELSRSLCKFLDEDKIFNFFKEEINKYLKIENCDFVKEQKPSSLDKKIEALVLPIKVDNKILRYLIALGVLESEKDKFYILSQQFILAIKRAILYSQVEAMAITDGLTAVSSRRYFLERLQEELVRSENFKYNFALLMADIDHFKSYNDRYGHLVGDAILKELARVIKKNLRQIDLIGRYGGEEFCIVLAETTKEQAKIIAERLRQEIAKNPIKVYDEELKITISIGVSTFPTDAKTEYSLIDKADRALYWAKQNGRNRICVWGMDN